MNDLSNTLNVVSDIYSAPGSRKNWMATVESLTHLVGGEAGVYFVLDGESLATDVAAYFGYDSEDLELYQSKYGAETDIRYQYMHNLIPGQVFREYEFVTDHEGYRNSKWIQYQQQKHGLYWCLSAHVSSHALWHDIIAVNRLEEKGPHIDEEKALLQALLPHLSRAMEIHRTVTRLENQYGAVLSVLDKLLVGLIIIDTKGRIAVSNSASQRISEESGAFRATPQGQLTLTKESKNLELQAMLKRVTDTASAQGQNEGGELMIPKRHTFGCVLLEVMPIRDDGFSDGDNIQGAAVFIIDPDRSEIVNTRGISKIFELTPAETDITRQIVDGHSLAEISEVRGASVHTVRSQLKKVFSKTGATSQADLVRLAVKANPPIE